MKEIHKNSCSIYKKNASNHNIRIKIFRRWYDRSINAINQKPNGILVHNGVL